MVGFWFQLGKDFGVKANVGFNLLLLNNARAINYRFKDSIYAVKSENYGFDIGIRASKNIDLNLKNSPNHYLEIESSLGIHYLDYDFPKRSDEEKKENNMNEVFPNTSLFWTMSFSYLYKNVGIKMQYRLTPMNLIGEIESNFGSSSLGFGLVYKQ